MQIEAPPFGKVTISRLLLVWFVGGLVIAIVFDVLPQADIFPVHVGSHLQSLYEPVAIVWLVGCAGYGMLNWLVRGKGRSTDTNVVGTNSKYEDLTIEEAGKIVNDYGAVLAKLAKSTNIIMDVSLLPTSKDRVKNALLIALANTPDRDVREQLKIGYIFLADFQPGVGDQRTGLDLSNIPIDDPLEAAKRIAAQGGAVEAMKKWEPICSKERESLMNELRALGY